MKRRGFIGFLGGAAVSWPLGARAQQAKPVIWFFNSGKSSAQKNNLAAFRQGLKAAGFTEDENVVIQFRWGENQFDRLPALASEVIASRPAIIVSNTLAALQAKTATTTIPIVFTTGSDPVRDGLVTSLNQPGGNVTGVVFIAGALGAKRLELLRQFIPTATTITMLIYPNSSETEAERRDVQAAAQAIGQTVTFLDIGSVGDIKAAFATLTSLSARALLVGTGPFLFNNLELIVALAARHAIPTMYSQREASEAGGLMSYGASLPDAFRQAGIYVGRILKGEKPADLPVMQSTKFEFVINLKTAKALNFEVPAKLLALADEVIE
jgi:putative tryptophan/tyrosine transport system substrate-binding protein